MNGGGLLLAVRGVLRQSGAGRSIATTPPRRGIEELWKGNSLSIFLRFLSFFFVSFLCIVSSTSYRLTSHKPIRHPIEQHLFLLSMIITSSPATPRDSTDFDERRGGMRGGPTKSLSSHFFWISSVSAPLDLLRL